MQTYIYKIAHEKINYIFLHISFNNLQLLSTLKVHFSSPSKLFNNLPKRLDKSSFFSTLRYTVYKTVYKTLHKLNDCFQKYDKVIFAQNRIRSFLYLQPFFFKYTVRLFNSLQNT